MDFFENYLEKIINFAKSDERFTAICCAGSGITEELDKYSDLDIVLITENNVVFPSDEMK